MKYKTARKRFGGWSNSDRDQRKTFSELIYGTDFFEASDMVRFKKQAEVYGYGLGDYLEALDKVSVIIDKIKNSFNL